MRKKRGRKKSTLELLMNDPSHSISLANYLNCAEIHHRSAGPSQFGWSLERKIINEPYTLSISRTLSPSLTWKRVREMDHSRKEFIPTSHFVPHPIADDLWSNPPRSVREIWGEPEACERPEERRRSRERKDVPLMGQCLTPYEQSPDERIQEDLKRGGIGWNSERLAKHSFRTLSRCSFIPDTISLFG